MVEISNKQRDEAVRYLQHLCSLVQGDDLRVVNLRRLAMRLADKLAKKEKR
jgi:hypothetical protein